MKKNYFKKFGVICTAILLLTSCKSEKTKDCMKNLHDKNNYIHVKNAQDVALIYPKTVDEIKARLQDAIAGVTNIINTIIATPQEQQNKHTMIYKLDQLDGCMCHLSIFSLVQYVFPDSAMQEAAAQASTQGNNFYTDYVSMNIKLYNAFKTYYTHNAQEEALTPEERYYLDELMKDFKRSGLDLAEEQRAEIANLSKEIQQIGQDFSRNISNDTSTIVVTKDELAGVSQDFIDGLKTNEAGLYILNTDYPTADMIGNYCSVQETRKKFSHAMKNKAYPCNVTLLNTLIEKRNELAHKLGFASYAALDLDDQMIKNPENAWKFEKNLEHKIIKKAQEEFKTLTAHLPEGVTLSPDGKLYSWDSGYVNTYFKKNTYNVDEQELAQYFPMEKTIAGLIDIYEKFFSLKITYLPVQDAWHPEVQLLQVADSTNTVLGYVYLDMFPRERKYNHAAQFGGITAHINQEGVRYPAVVTLVCNFTKPTLTKPSLLRYNEVNTFFHEFGHALHSILGATKLASQAGTSVKRDFVELPSQMLENWLEDKEIVKNLSSHYQTGTQIPDKLLDQKLSLLKFGQAMNSCVQIGYAMVALDYFGPETRKDTAKIWQDHFKRLTPYMIYDETTHQECNFGHLTGYGAKYYGYMWSDVLGQDVFEQIEKAGLLNPEIGKKYIECILGKGGSKDPNLLLQDFLGREPNDKAFFKKLNL